MSRVEVIGNATLYLGDCMDVLPAVASADVVISDLPYGTTQNRWDAALPLTDLWAHIGRIAGGRAILTSQGLFTASLMLSNARGFKYKWVWEKSKATNFLNAKRQPLRAHEDVCVFGAVTYDPQFSAGVAYNKGVRKDQLTGSYGDFSPVEVKSEGRRYPRDVIYFATAESEGAVLHPTQKPLGLMDYIVRTHSIVGHTVLDPCMGVASTGVAALNAGRAFIGIEQDERFFDLACERVSRTIDLARAA